ncbi:putative reverse transcriptase domain-containing protein [Tanacetum coccineum]|uniref:Reverse transcriptase domain-containing protein n=1 Tax=Tanacetum coccineum TaxID=301880 RepID=A0ABQ5EVV9_9ASTR
MKCQPLFFRGTEGVVDLTQWFERMETVFRISNCTVENQVKFATCTLMGTALTWWNSHARTVTHNVAYAMTWTDLKKKMTTKYCPRNEIKKIEAELWNLKVKGTDVVAYNQRFQELALLSDRMFPEETDKIERYVGGMPDLIYSSVVASKPKTMQEAIEMATELMDRRINTIAERQTENKRKFEDTPRNNQNQQPNKRQNTGRAYAAGNGDKKPYEGTKPRCPKCNFNHYGPCIPTCTNCKKLGHLAKDCRSRPATANNNNRNNNNNNNRNNNNNNNRNNNNPRAQGANTNAIICFECGAPGHFKKDCPQWKNKNQGNGNGVARAYAVGVAGQNPDNNVVTGKIVQVPFGSENLNFHGEEGLPTYQQVEFRIDLYLLLAPIARDSLIIGPIRNERIGGSTTELFRQKLYKPYFSPWGGSSSIRQEERRIVNEDSSDLHKSEPTWQVSKEGSETKTSRRLPSELDMDIIKFQFNLFQEQAIARRASEYNIGVIEERGVVLLGIIGFIEGFSKIAKPMTKLTQKKVKFEWGDKQEAAFQLLKQKLCSAPILALPEGSEDFIQDDCDLTIKGLGAVLIAKGKGYFYCITPDKDPETNYTTHIWNVEIVLFALKI